MKPAQYYVLCALGALCLVLGISVLVLGRATYTLAATVQQRQNAFQVEAQKRQEAINKGALSQQVGNNLIQAVAEASLKNEKLKNLLTKYGLTVTTNPAPGGSAPTGTPAPAPPSPSRP